jgi:O-antigen/teichoic acid export membrane protein
MIPSIRIRFALTLVANLFRLLLSFATGMLLARWLGPDLYGKMAFLLGTFLAVGQLLDMGSSSAFFTFLSQRQRSKQFVSAFFVWLAIQFLVPLCMVGLLFPSQWIAAIWHGEQRGLVLLAFVAAFMQSSVWPIIQQAGESNRETLWVQVAGTLIMMVHLSVVALLWWSGLLGLYAVFAILAFEYAVAAVVTYRRLSNAFQTTEVSVESGSSIFRQYLKYCLPLIPYSWMGFIYSFADRWLLQNYGGNVQQAYYAVGAQFASIALIATSSIMNIFWKEVAEAHHRGDHVRTGVLYQKVSRLLFLVSAVIAGFLVPWTEDLLKLILGAAYVGGATTLTIMFIYPVHQSMGTIGGTMLYATGRVRIQVLAGIVFMIASMIGTYFVLAPPQAAVPGLGLGSEGLAVKMVIMQFLLVNVIAYIIAKISGWRFDWVYQPVSLLGCLALGWGARYAVAGDFGPALGAPIPVQIIFAGLFYLVLVAALVWAVPSLVGLTRLEFDRNARQLWNGVTRLYRRG